MTAQFEKACRISVLTVTMLVGGGFQYVAEGESFQEHLTSSPTLIPAADPASSPGPFEQSVASVQALVMDGHGTIYAGSFGHGIFRSADRGSTWVRVGGE